MPAIRNIRISDEVWQEIAKRGKFGETEEDVLRRVFKLVPAERGMPGALASHTSPSTRRGTRQRLATVRMHAGVHRSGPAGKDQLLVSFEHGAERRWEMPDRADKAELRRIRQEAVEFALSEGASDPGQTNAVRKALTEGGYHLTR